MLTLISLIYCNCCIVFPWTISEVDDFWWNFFLDLDILNRKRSLVFGDFPSEAKRSQFGSRC